MEDSRYPVCSTSGRVVTAYNGTRGAMDHFGTALESQTYRDGGTYVFGESFFGKETVAGPGAGIGGAAW